VRPELKPPSTTTHTASPEQERLARILDEYLVAIEQGQCVSPEELLAKYPGDADQLRGYLSGLQLFHAAAIVPGGSRSASQEPGVPAGLQTMGDYRLIREIGRGGMGVVYEAWQISLRRRIALKLLPFTSSHDTKQISRFKNEAQAAAQAQHPNIVPVFAIGEENGAHYYVMQLIEGQSLTSLLAALRNSGDPPCGTTAPNVAATRNDQQGEAALRRARPAVSQEERSVQPMRASETADHIRVVARLGIQAAEALHAAHEIGIIHRDVKPSNLLLDDQGKLWITDFGLARCRENQGLTQTGDVLGTMRYTSPEQALGRTTLVDHRSDLYSLGLTLYELATLNHPADDVSDLQLLFDRNRPPVKPLRYWNRNIPRDFETIVLKCMAEFPHERYGTARELAEDLERFLDGRPIVASPPGIITRATKWAKRRRGVVYAATAVLLLAAGGLVASNWMLARETAAKNQALAHAVERLRVVGLVLDSFANEYTDQLAGLPGAESLRQGMIEDCIDFYRRFESEAHDAPSLTADMAVAYGRLGGLYDKLGKRSEAMGAMQKALATWKKLVTSDPENCEHVRSLAECENNLGLLLSDEGNHVNALELLEAAKQSQEQLRRGQPNRPDIAVHLATTHNNIGLVRLRLNLSDEAAKEFRAAIELAEPLTTSADKSVDATRAVAAAYNNLAPIYESTDLRAAFQAYRKSIDYQISLVKKFPVNRLYQAELARTYNNLGHVTSQSNDWPTTERCFADAIRIQENLVKGSPLAAAYRRDLAISYNNLGMAQLRSGRLDDAESALRKAVEAHDVLIVAAPSDAQTLSNQGNVWNNLAKLLDRKKLSAEAGGAYGKAIEFQKRALALAPNDVARRRLLNDEYHVYASHLVVQRKYDEAIGITMERGKLWRNNSEMLFSVAQDLASVYRRLNEPEANTQSKAKCVEAAAAVVRAALAGGLSRKRLEDRSLSGLAQDDGFVKQMNVPLNEFSQAL